MSPISASRTVVRHFTENIHFMKQKIKKWTLRIGIIVLCFMALLFVIVLNPTFLYANKTSFGKYMVYHNKPIENNYQIILTNANKLLKSSEIYDSSFRIDICLNDGSFYPTLIQWFQDPAFGIGFYNKVVLMGNTNWKENYNELNEYKWNLTQLIVHETLHCFQFNKFGLWKSNPVANYPHWKWEGYNEYIARQNSDQINLLKNITRLNAAEIKNTNEWGIRFADSTYVGKYYYKWWILMQYCKDVKNMSYQKILHDTTKEEVLRQEMMNWYNRKQ
jgi:hypothetical protein